MKSDAKANSKASKIRAFGDLPPEFAEFQRAKAAILPIPFDGTSTWGKGADGGPAAMLEASANMELYDIETGSEVYRQGIFTAEPVLADTPEEVAERGFAACNKLLEAGKFVLTFGGEHSISYGPIKAHAAKYQNLSVLQLDAHTDLRDSYHGSRHNHACIMARAKELVGTVVQVGIRSMDRSELGLLDRKKAFFAEHIHGSTTWIAKVVDLLSENVYLTVDLDVFDPGVLPSTGTPEPGGLTWYQVLELIREVSRQRNLVGCDVVELAPSPASPASDFLAAKLVYKILTYKFCPAR